MPSRARIVPNRHGTLAIRFHWRGRPIWEGTGLADTPANRARLEVVCARITEDLAGGTFDEARYLFFFPEGNQAHRCTPALATRAIPTLRAYAEEWVERMEREGMRRGTLKTYRSHLSSTMDLRLPDGLAIGDLRVNEITRRRMLQCRSTLLGRLSVSRAKCIMAGGLRRVVNAAIAEELLELDPFVSLGRWPRQEGKPPDPFTREERDLLIGHFQSTIYGAFVFLLFHTGMRPSEAVALRESDVNIETGMCRIVRSRVMGEENEPKTAASRRTIRLAPAVCAELRRVPQLRPDPDRYVFTDGRGEPIDQSAFKRGEWSRALVALGLRPRKFYATRHTFISIAVSLGRNFKWLGTYCGTSGRMIERHYAVYLPDAGGDQLDALATEAEKSQVRLRQPSENVQLRVDASESGRGNTEPEKPQ